ncbi:MAG TPA: hypothetical protein VNK46_16110 [Nitrospiraceae bacterium]|jgi:hypothetical protein|nr:hypothetical protein [Nitrospiraceae bacterium]
MKKKKKKTIGILCLAVISGCLTAHLADAAGSKSSKSAPPPQVASKPAPMKMDTKPGPAFQMVEGKLNKIDGDIYVVEDYNGNEVRLYVGKETKRLRGNKKVGDTVRAEITRGGFANSIQ